MKKVSMALAGMILLGAVAPAMAATTAAIELAPTVITAEAPSGQVAGGGHERHGGDFEKRDRKGGPFAELNLTEEQKTQLKAIHIKHREMAKEDILKVLTPEQAAKFEELKSKRPEHAHRNYELNHVEDKVK
jgi:Spy/CpxP family protein refolding chaperone